MTITLSLTDPRTVLHQLCAALVRAQRAADAERLWQDGQKARDAVELVALLPADIRVEVEHDA